ncbi:extracellular solute-binding protein [Paenibacillus sp. GYB003]|uniref:extracellular solute-binding protein n=1 Tax=Paenibacillus sp. GYB003 TaxID=2994392 RepID=UPI002F96D494
MVNNKWTALVLSVVMTAGLLAACSDKGGGSNGPASGKPSDKSDDTKGITTAGFPIVKQPISLKIFAGQSPSSAANWNEAEIWKEYAKMTNINVDFQMTPFESLTEKRNLVLASGDLPDAFHTSRFTSTDLINYGTQGYFIPLEGLIDKYAPNFKKMMDKYPEIRKGLTMPDGHIYSLPSFYDPDFKSVIVGSQLWINEKYLKALGLKEPTTTEEFYQYLKAVKTGDPNGNGKNDEIPYASSGYGTLLDQLKGAWGLGNRGNMQPYWDVDPSTNKVRFIPADPRYKELLEYMNRLYKEGLFNPDILTAKSAEFRAKGKDGTYGSFLYTNARGGFGVENNDYIGANALTGPHGDRIFSRARTAIADVGSFVITKANKNPEATIRWIDYFYSEEGSMLFFMGIKGKSYEEKPDGTVDYTEEIKKNEELRKKYVTWMGGYYPAMLTSRTFKGGEGFPENLEATKKNEPYWPKEVWSPFIFTNDEMSQMNGMATDINTYVGEMTTKFITGDAPLTQWDTYVAQLKKMGLDRYITIYNAAYERYKK